MDAVTLSSSSSMSRICHIFSSSHTTNRLLVRQRRAVKVIHGGGDDGGGMKMPPPLLNCSYAAPIDSYSGAYMQRPLAEILRDMNKRVPEQVLRPDKSANGNQQNCIPWYQANRMLSFYAPGWCGEVRNITFSSDGEFVTVVYRITLCGSDGEAYREASGTVSMTEVDVGDPVQQAEAMAFCRACARFGLGLYLYDN